jgi:Universal stress protein UspA and related nucleotide-binding proteins
VVRALQRPILVVGDTFRAPRRALIAYDGGIVTRRGVEMLAGCDLLRGVSIDLLMVGHERSSAEEKKLETARAKLQTAGFTVTASHLPGDAETVIAQVARERDIDLMVMGAYAHSPLRRLFLGSRTNQLLRAVQVPTLLLR